MEAIKLALFLGIDIFIKILIARIIIEMIVTMSRSYTGPSWFNKTAEIMFMITDPPVKLMRRLIPPLKVGNVALDISILVLFVLLSVVLVLLSSL
ncbi:YggT family protein [Corynebacterium sp. HS2168-gen11]|uniref:YggT family protein n=1 Tax=Corynebacterium sp. HS2168-gen11 TaxID=2974027 RepID=UPI00216ACEAA|nr:YggT family protein [Corynebacterium sp. HS2168-gen11]MCS4536203.1 YggT family protein [Corynebacterium sp. HS2168-gen11]